MYLQTIFEILILACSASVFSQAPSVAVKPNVLEDPCSVSGTVYRGEDNAPLKGATVQLFLDNDRDHSIATKTLADGQFRLKNLPAGQYNMSVSRNGYVTTKYGQRKASDPGTKLSLHEGQAIQDLIFRLERAAVITGRVFDEDGEPMPDVTITAMRQVFHHGKKRLDETASGQGNDLGEYRIYGLAPGRYFLSVEPTDWEHPVGEKQYSGTEKAGPEKAYTKMYYPGTTDLSRASLVQVKVAEEIPSVDFMMKQLSVVRVRGRIISLVPKGTERTMLDVQMMPKNQSELYGRMFFSGVRVHSDGTFELPNVTPGEYTIIGWLYGEQVHSAQQDIEVGSTDVEGLTLVVGMGVNVRGTVVWEGKASIAKDGLMAAAIPATGEFGFGGALSALDKNSQFLWKDLSEGQFRIDVMGMGKDCYVKEIRMGENRMEGNVIRLNRSGGEVEITISSQGGKIQGTVLTSESLPLANAWAVAVAENSVAGKKAWAATTDQNGHYELQGLPPGKYKIYSWQDLEEGSWEDQDVLKEYEEKGERVELQSGEAKGMDLNLIPLKDGPKQPE